MVKKIFKYAHQSLTRFYINGVFFESKPMSLEIFLKQYDISHEVHNSTSAILNFEGNKCMLKPNFQNINSMLINYAEVTPLNETFVDKEVLRFPGRGQSYQYPTILKEMCLYSTKLNAKVFFYNRPETLSKVSESNKLAYKMLEFFDYPEVLMGNSLGGYDLHRIMHEYEQRHNKKYPGKVIISNSFHSFCKSAQIAPAHYFKMQFVNKYLGFLTPKNNLLKFLNTNVFVLDDLFLNFWVDSLKIATKLSFHIAFSADECQNTPFPYKELKSPNHLILNRHEDEAIPHDQILVNVIDPDHYSDAVNFSNDFMSSNQGCESMLFKNVLPFVGKLLVNGLMFGFMYSYSPVMAATISAGALFLKVFNDEGVALLKKCKLESEKFFHMLHGKELPHQTPEYEVESNHKKNIIEIVTEYINEELGVYDDVLCE